MSIPLEELNLVENVEPESICRTVTDTECLTDLGFQGSFDQCNTDQEKYMLFEAFCVYESHVLLHYEYISTIANQELGIDNIIFSASILDGLSILIFIFGILWIGREQRYEEKEYNMLTTRASQYTLECHTIPKHSKGGPVALREKLRTHFETVLSQQPFISSNEKIQIADINFATGHYEYIRAACDRGKLAAGMDRLIGKFTSRLRLGTFNFTSWSSISLLNQVKKLMFKFEIANAKCERLQERASREILKAFITFETEEGYLRCIKTYSLKSILLRLIFAEYSKL